MFLIGADRRFRPGRKGSQLEVSATSGKEERPLPVMAAAALFVQGETQTLTAAALPADSRFPDPAVARSRCSPSSAAPSAQT